MYKQYELKSIKISKKHPYKYVARFYSHETGRHTNTHFGDSRYKDYTQHNDKEKKKNYLARHKANEDWSNPITAGSLSRYILWNKKSFQKSVKDYKAKFFQ
jgi:hypothetical protein